ncbi:MAG TPA: polyhydroxyalkanoic acid system family protein [Chitinophagaceae bacterium]|nr:polyhydroxyalkanoic acid system family protein [Chitinophagaceae bacterium]
MEIDVPFSIPREEAVSRIKNLLTEVKNEHGAIIKNLTESWEGNTGSFSFTAQGFDISGTLTVNENSLHLDARLPMALTMFKGTISKMITDRAANLLA